jgi:hypothetical protein
MTTHITASALAIAAALALSAAAPAAFAQATPTTPAKKPAAAKVAKKAPAKAPVEPPPPAAASPEQIDAAERVYYGVYECEFKQTVNIVASTKFPSYVDVKHAKFDYLMKPVLSSTGAIRLEDVRGEMLMVQVSSKSMVLNVKTGQRVVDDCISPKQRELTEAAKAKAVADAASASSAAPAATAVSASAPAMTTMPVALPTK